METKTGIPNVKVRMKRISATAPFSHNCLLHRLSGNEPEKAPPGSDPERPLHPASIPVPHGGQPKAPRQATQAVSEGKQPLAPAIHRQSTCDHVVFKDGFVLLCF